MVYCGVECRKTIFQQSLQSELDFRYIAQAASRLSNATDLPKV